MEEITSEEANKDKTTSQPSFQKPPETNLIKNNYISTLNEEETSLWLKNLNLNEELLKEIENIIKNGKDLISVYNNNKLLEKLNIDLHTTNIINDAIEEGLEEQLKLNISLDKGKNIILNIENEPKYKLKDLLSYLEKLLKRAVYLTPINSPNEILTPNTLIVKKILLNPNKYCNLQLFDDKKIVPELPQSESRSHTIVYPKSENININLNKNKNVNTNDILLNNNNDNINLNQNNSGGKNLNLNLNLGTPNTNTNTSNLNTTNTNVNLNTTSNTTNTNINTKISNISNMSKGGYVSLFQNKKNNLPDFSTDYSMPSQNRPTGNNTYKKLENKNKPLEDFKYHNILNMKDKEEKEDKSGIISDMRYTIDNTSNNNDSKNIGFKNITENDNNNSNMGKNYFTQRNFNSKNISNDNNIMFTQMYNKKKSEKNLPGMMGKNAMDTHETDDNPNLSFLERNKKDKDRGDRDFNLNFINKDNNNDLILKKQINNKTETRYEFSRFQDMDKIDKLDKDNNNIFNNKNLFGIPKPKQDNNNNSNNEININNLIITSNNNNQKEELKTSKEKEFKDFKFGINNKEESDNDILKILREKYSMQSNDSKDLDTNNNNSNNRINLDFKKDYKPKTPIAEGRRTINNDNMNFKFGNITDDNNSNPLENKFLLQQNDEYIKFGGNFMNKNPSNFNHQEDEDNLISKFKMDMNMDNNINNKVIRNRPSAGLEFNSFKYKAAGYKSAFSQNQENDLNQYNQDEE